MKQISTKIYLITFIFTLCIFITALFVSNYINRQKTAELQAEEDKISIDILSTETQVDVLKDASCSEVASSNLRSELDSLNSRLGFMEQQVGDNDPEVFRLKRYYSLLEIRDYLLQKDVATKCHTNPVLILYFYSLKQCNDCEAAQYMLQAIQQKYPDVRVYSFDYNLDLPAVQTLITLHNIPKNPPVIDINSKAYASFPSLEDLDYIVGPLVNATSTPATSSKATNTKKITQ